MDWKNNKGSGISIAIIDSGIDNNRKEFFDAKVYHLQQNTTDELGHGTAIASIIHKFVPKAELYDYKLFSADKYVSTQELIQALEELSSIKKFDIIHLSSGVIQCDELDRLYLTCEKIVQNGTIIVSAFDNEGCISYPAAFDNVIGVDWSDKCANGMQYIFVENSPVNVLGIGSLQKLPWSNGEYKYVAGSSFAAPYITALVACLNEAGIIDLDSILGKLKENSWKKVFFNVNNDRNFNKDFRIEKAIIYPFNKEIHSLFRYSDLLPFKIDGVFEPVIFRRTGISVGSLLGIDDINHTIRSEKEIPWEEPFDTVILGHVGLISSALKRDILGEFLDKCIFYKKNIFTFDNLSDYQNKLDKLNECGCFYYYPIIRNNEIDKTLMGKLYSISAPVLGIFGTSPKQGKFTLQLALRKYFQSLGYKVGGLGTEPSSLLFGLNQVYPMGYESSVEVSGADAVVIINSLMHKIDIKNNDIIIVGSQSNTVPFNSGNIGLYPISQHEFLIGTEPDAIILCINPFDDVNYIKRTICYLENYIQTSVIALSLYPMHRDFEWAIAGSNFILLDMDKLYNRKNYYREQIGIPCFILGEDSELEELCNGIIDFYK